ncbi:MAG TPA: class I SAM-dependent methyltransferase [Pyrinomonadaceae bacterium]|nr:class I SAM-dependent methyltransferase [Pyrinomonadaceae bacterium]
MEQNLDKEVITFSFGKNWRSYVDTVNENAVARARKDIEEWLGADAVEGKTVLDIGCGSGIHSLCFHLLGAKEIVSLDVDPYSVESTRLLWERAGRPSNWKIIEGSVLDKNFVAGLGKYEVVYSWGVLHHTGSMWEAVANACTRVREGGLMWLALYRKGPSYPHDLALKQSYNRASKLGKKMMEWKYIYGLMRQRWREGQNPLAWNEKRERGMDVYHDIVDWLGGLPYEVATAEEVEDFCRERGFETVKIDDDPTRANILYLFSLPAARAGGAGA